MTSVVVRACSEADWAPVVHVDQLAFGYTFDEEENAADRNVLELDRSFLAYVGDTPVGHTTAFSLCMSVPVGREVAFAGVTWVGVLPTHRRRARRGTGDLRPVRLRAGDPAAVGVGPARAHRARGSRGRGAHRPPQRDR